MMMLRRESRQSGCIALSRALTMDTRDFNDKTIALMPVVDLI